ncbi:stage III sporulation protein AG [Paenibacillus sp. y28]|uniref:stage III sporulation protein AG n=1 Tax=Paenibacillus sp. y28 TaxID=3129110 RepID=UPI00301849C5
MQNWWKRMEQWFGGGPGGGKRVSTLRWLLLLGLIGVALMLMNSFWSKQDFSILGDSRASPPYPEQPAFSGGASGSQPQEFKDAEAVYQLKIKEILQKIVGVGDVEVLITLDTSEEIVVQQNTRDTQQVTNENDNNGTKRTVTDMSRTQDVVTVQGSGGQQPVIVKRIQPKIRGIVIVAVGAENLTVKKMVVEAVSRGLDVPTHRVSVLPRKQ